MYYCQNMLSYEKAYIIITPATKCSTEPHVTHSYCFGQDFCNSLHSAARPIRGRVLLNFIDLTPLPQSIAKSQQSYYRRSSLVMIRHLASALK